MDSQHPKSLLSKSRILSNNDLETALATLNASNEQIHMIGKNFTGFYYPFTIDNALDDENGRFFLAFFEQIAPKHEKKHHSRVEDEVI